MTELRNIGDLILQSFRKGLAGEGINLRGSLTSEGGILQLVPPTKMVFQGRELDSTVSFSSCTSLLAQAL